MKHSLFIVASIAAAAHADVISLSPVADSTIYDNGTSETSNSRGQHIFAGTNAVASARRGLVKFDVAAALPANATIQQATLTLTITRQASNASVARLFRCTSAWGEGTSQAFGNEGGGASATSGDPSWSYASFSTRRWAHAGGDFAAAASDSRTAGATATLTFAGTAVTNDVVSWATSPASNSGWILLGDEVSAGSAIRFGSRENADPDARPTLVITFTVACAADFNHDESVDFFDYLDFVDAFSSLAAEADFNHDNSIDFFDYLDFVDAFSTPC
jgi:hypothetical protein